MAKLVKYFKDTKAELKKVTWPSKKQIKNNTGIIIVFILIVAVFLFVCDLAFGGLRQALLNLF
ncbi:MAG: preprotein translocase subunit SecE [Clostridia bacterium]|nr:preprotein translocase subunit SecE [Clostridia bacterium]